MAKRKKAAHRKKAAPRKKKSVTRTRVKVVHVAKKKSKVGSVPHARKRLKEALDAQLSTKLLERERMPVKGHKTKRKKKTKEIATIKRELRAIGGIKC